jgi:hypothetical protein
VASGPEGVQTGSLFKRLHDFHFPFHRQDLSYKRRLRVMKTTLVISLMLFSMLLLVPEYTSAQPFSGFSYANPLGGVPAGMENGGFHFHINPLEDHPAYESLDKDSYQYYALHGYEHCKGKDLQKVDRFPDIQYPKKQPAARSSYDTFFGVESYNPYKW